MEVTPRSESRILLATSLTVVTSCMAAAHLALYDCLVAAIAILFFSVNYWRRPVHGWRRNLDIANIVIGLTYQLIISRKVDAVSRHLYIASTACGLACFGAGYKFPGRKGTLIHSCGHVFGNVANAFLYPGLVKARGIEPPPVDAADMAIYALVLAAVLDVWFLGGWPPKWWPTRVSLKREKEL